MEVDEIIPALRSMREAQVLARRVAIASRNVIDLVKAQTTIDAIDRAIAEESKTPENPHATGSLDWGTLIDD